MTRRTALLLLLLVCLRYVQASRPLAAVSTTRSSRNSTLKRQRRPRPRLPPWTATVLAGGSSRAFAQAVLYPVDALRTLAQTRDARTLADVGTNALVRGCLTTSSFALVQGAIQFGIFGLVRDHAPQTGPIVASALGAAGSCVVSVPQDLIKQRLVTGVYPSFRQATSTIFKEEGLRGFYSAWRPTVTRNVPFVITTFTTMDFMKERILARRRRRRRQQSLGTTTKRKNSRTINDNDTDNNDKEQLTTLENFMIGIGSALVGGIVTQPVDVVKTRMMTQAASTAVPYTSALDCVGTILRTEGVLTLYSGFTQRAIYMGGLWGITFALNGYFLRQRQQQQQSQSL